ncbi:unnamed protein product [Effrenium voratum]|uniref:Uncharacterized protein n=1 Tax=Effrenium voratum TaxID=2562239 RepID=A0AA36IZL4_9DINO|nr:unnamed protein product [Effrenium voratum]CAJ1396402.1 unnamed protein product [Effrenium voratum]CAJ1438626.1 unnamed protein product [Effrenium voratum]|mmetsp:Transcript_68007/g.162333  ORF Transcript_68007/g.162333 Transcript_68007/m.162333 type:complete len:239 (+) Transcript_68007:37-753(+)|eukprot:CAMPEP_0181535920 /NCGR_PEP_ID=MMETSP1110-20121109/74530_1 /TAXON_ID=174948 /ORGANISM="Symbiodinium sp., Strain CCMP421" /LENGTH=238 /DNA_ID=CAMNT_0023667367 /DNA_START=32 /DNA_END=748 /DNA_ORIENTATION=-
MAGVCSIDMEAIRQPRAVYAQAAPALQLPSDPPSPAGSLVFTPVNAPSTYWRTTICPNTPHKGHACVSHSADSTPRSGPPTPAVLWPSAPSPCGWGSWSFAMSPTNGNTWASNSSRTLSSAFPDSFGKQPMLRRACTLPTAPEIESDEEEDDFDIGIDRTVSESQVTVRPKAKADEVPSQHRFLQRFDAMQAHHVQLTPERRDKVHGSRDRENRENSPATAEKMIRPRSVECVPAACK